MTTPRRRPGRPRLAEQRATADLIVEAATGLFARHGFDAVGVRDIAATAGVDVSTVHHHAGTKSDLYDACFARVFQAEQAALREAAEAALAAVAAVADCAEDTGDAAARTAFAALHELLDAFVDFLEDRPETTALWLRRWLEPERHAEFDARYAAPLYRQVERALAEADAAGLLTEPVPHIAVRSLVWAVHAHVVSLLSGRAGARERRELRAFLHRWLDRMYGPAAG